jgi:hypothetical protein
LQPTQRQRVFQVALVWGEDLLVDMEPVTARGFTHLPFSENIGAGGSAPRVQLLTNGDAVVILPVGSNVRIGRGDALLAPADLFAAGEATPVELPVRGLRYVLGLRERVLVEGQSLRIVGRYLRPEDAPARPLGERLDVQFITTGIIALLFLIFVGALLRVSLRLGPTLSDDPQRNAPGSHFFKSAPPRVVRQPPLAAAGDVGSLGHPKANLPDARPGARGGPVVDEHHKPLSRADILASGLLGLLAPGGAAAELGQGGLTDNLKNALGGLHGPEVGDIGGNGGYGPRGTGPGGGGVDPIGIGKIGQPGSHGFNLCANCTLATVIVPPQNVRVTDGLSKDIVGRVVRKHWNEIRSCYEHELNRAPNLAGKVAVAFRIGPLGDVVAAGVRESTLESSSAQQCILADVRQWVFPHPAGGGVVDVSYPFLFDTRP